MYSPCFRLTGPSSFSASPPTYWTVSMSPPTHCSAICLTISGVASKIWGLRTGHWRRRGELRRMNWIREAALSGIGITSSLVRWATRRHWTIPATCRRSDNPPLSPARPRATTSMRIRRPHLWPTGNWLVSGVYNEPRPRSPFRWASSVGPSRLAFWRTSEFSFILIQ